MANKEVHIGDDWYLDENNDGDLIFYNSRKNEVVKAIDVITGAEDKKGKKLENVSGVLESPLTEDLDVGGHSIDKLLSFADKHPVKLVSTVATGGNGTESDPYTHLDGTGGVQTIIDSFSDYGGLILWDGVCKFENRLDIPETQLGDYFLGTSPHSGFILDSSFTDSEAVRITGKPTNDMRTYFSIEEPRYSHRFENLRFRGNKANVTADVDGVVLQSNTTDLFGSHITFFGTHIQNFSNIGFRTYYSNLTWLIFSEVLGCDNYGVKLEESNADVVQNCNIEVNGRTDAVEGLIVVGGVVHKIQLNDFGHNNENVANAVQLKLGTNSERVGVFNNKFDQRTSQDKIPGYIDLGSNNIISNNWEHSTGRVPDSPDDVVTGIAGDNTANTLTQNYTGGDLFLVFGASGAGNAFVDLLLLLPWGVIFTTVGSAEYNTPGIRTYSASGGNIEIAIDDTGATYDVSVRQISVRQTSAFS